MTEPELLDVVELLVDLPEHHLRVGMQGAIVAMYGQGLYEVEFTHHNGETLTLCLLSAMQFFVVWKVKQRSRTALADQIGAIVSHLSEDRKQQVLDFARFLYQR